MESIKKFILLLSKNYYLDFIVDIENANTSLSKGTIIEYRDKQYYELPLNEIRSLQSKILREISEEYKNSLTEIYLDISKSNFENISILLRYSIRTIKLQLNVIKDDFDIENKRSKYCTSILEENIKLSDILRNNKNEFDFSHNKTKQDVSKLENIYGLTYLIERYKTLSYLPFSLFCITNRFLIELKELDKEINELKENNEEKVQIEWTGKKKHIGYIFGTLALEGYIDAPKLKSGDINYTKFSKLLKQKFKVDVGEETLRKYLNPSDNKFEESKRAFKKENFHLPNVKEIN